MSHAAPLHPSVTLWTRLEPSPYQATMEQTLQARIADPLWLLSRQFQVGEFAGEDAGSPVRATLSVESRDLTWYAPDGAAPGPLDPALPVETHAEREDVALSLRAAMQWGLKFERMASAAGASPGEIAQYRQAFPIPAASSDDLPDPRSSAFRTLISSRVTNGVALYAALVAGQAMPVTATDLTSVRQDFRGYRESLYSEPAADPAWADRDLRYEFSVGSVAADQIALRAPQFDGDRVDWYSFDPAAPAATPGQPTTARTQTFTFLPQHVTFRGMPAPGWWELEDAQTDFGQVDAAHVDFAKMLMMEFALIFGGDWFEVPVPVEVGSLTRIDSLVVTDTFGYRTLIRSAADVDQSAGQGPWSMFSIADDDQRLDWMLMPPSLGTVMDAEPLEEVLFLRDDQAALAWGVERRLAGPLDRALDGYEAWRQRLRQQPEATPPSGSGPDIWYLLQTTVPDNWIPLVPVLAPSGAPFLRRGLIERPGTGGPVPVLAHGVILHAQAPFFVRDEAVPAAGVAVTRRLRRCRWLDGQTYVWSARLVRPGSGAGWSGLAYDLVLPSGQVPPEMQPRP